ncbi:MAG: L,D-transpeptidase [Pseudorhodoplanes sp.]|nr:L,D-transpeptidase [Pseudorhodoplanes sp.]
MQDSACIVPVCISSWVVFGGSPVSAFSLCTCPSNRGAALATALTLALALIVPAALEPADAAVARRIKREAPAKADARPQIPAGQLHIMISIRSQTVTVYSDGVVAARSRVSTGMKGFPTPTGVFSVIQKNRHHRSNIYSGAPMPFMQRLTWSGIALHQGALPGYPASHGCIRLNQDFAQTLWKRTRLGARVVVTQQEAEPYPFTHPKLFMPKAVRLSEARPELRGTLRTAQADTTANDAERLTIPDGLTLPDYPPVADVTADIRQAILDEDPNAKKPARPSGPVSVFISRKDRKLYVRQGFTPLFETLVNIRDDDQPFGTHVFSAIEAPDSNVKWIAVSLPVDVPKPKLVRPAPSRKLGRKAARAAEPAKAEPVPAPVTPEAGAVLSRIDIPQDAIARIEALLGPGASLIVADAGLGWETGKGTDFIVLTR